MTQEHAAPASGGRLRGMTAWISGASSGIGEATALLMAQQGAAVAVVANDAPGCERVARAITDAGGQALALTCDVADEQQVRASIDRAAQTLGGLQILVNNAGIVDVCPLHESTRASWDRLMAINVSSIFFAVKHGLPHLRRHARSYVVNVGSISSLVGQASTPAYTTSKHAVLGLTRSIALDYAADGLRCNCVCPGITDTPMLRHHLRATGDEEAALRQRLQRVCMGVALSPRDVARSIVYLSCEDSAGITGTSLVIDCGYLSAAEWNHPGHTRFMEAP